MTKDELLFKIYQKPLNVKIKMTVQERCELQKLLTEVLKYDLTQRDREIFEHHSNHFEDDILLIISDLEMKVAQELATIAMASGRIAEKFNVRMGK